MIGASFSKIKIDLSPNLSLPSMVRFLSFGNKSSCATGFDRETPVRAAGEALERQIAFSKNIVDCKKVNIKTLKPNIRDWSYKLFNQSKNLTDNYSYDCVEVFDTQDNSKALAPFIFFTLSSQPDDCFFPNRDSSGSAVHINSKDAINSAINEFIESNLLYETSVIVTPTDAGEKLREASGAKLPSDLVDDISKLVDMFCYLFDINKTGLRLAVLDRAMCPRFHVDRVPCRLVSTYRGVATDWLSHADVDRTQLGPRAECA